MTLSTTTTPLFSFPSIGTMRTCFKEKFGIPRQPFLVPEAKGILQLHPPFGLEPTLRGLEKVSHLWIIFVFHQNRDWKPLVRPPRMGGVRKIGVFASRSPHRPNPIGLSVVKLEKIDFAAKGGIELHLSGVDFLDGTPVLDIKPYLPYADSIPQAQLPWAPDPPEVCPVYFSDIAQEKIAREQKEKYPHLRPHLEKLIREIFHQDPRPACQKGRKRGEGEERGGGIRLLDYDVKWVWREGSFWILDLVIL